MRIGRASPGIMARPDMPVGGRVRKSRAVEDQSSSIPVERTSKLGGIIFSCSLRPCLGQGAFCFGVPGLGG
jgi:hypothetical protein